MLIDVTEESVANLSEYAAIPIAFAVDCRVAVFAPTDAGGPLVLRDRRVEAPYIKDYDALDGGPSRWPERFDLADWVFFAARVDGRRVGGAAIAMSSADERGPLRGAKDVALLWDIRVSPDLRRQGVGTALFRAAEACAAARGCRRLLVETQDINAAAAHFYARRGCVLESVNPVAYPALPDEVQLMWTRDLSGSRPRP